MINVYCDSIAPVSDKLLKPDGSVVTYDYELILPPDPARAKEYENRSAAADKWLRPDGSVTDMAGNILLPPDEKRAQEYASYAAFAVFGYVPGGNVGGDNIWIGTRAEYNTLSVGERNDPGIIHFIKEGS